MGNKIGHKVSRNTEIDEAPGVFKISMSSKQDGDHHAQGQDHSTQDEEDPSADRAQWGSGVQFLMSCIAFSVGLGNVWRFPNTAYENGGGAFLIPYLVVLFVIGKPFYYMEMILGQFTSRSCVEIWSISPAFKGIGYGVTVSVFCVVSYYCALMALTLYYLIASFYSPLPWSTCLEEWGDSCYDATTAGNETEMRSNNISRHSSAEHYFLKVVLHESGIESGLGTPSWKLVLCLLGSWLCVYIVVAKGVKSTGKASYFLALFPYVIMICLLVRAVTLEGAIDGIIFLYNPDWEKILRPRVWYAAVTQAFFSLGVCFGAVTMYSSYNNFNRNVARDCMIVTTLDLFTSLMAGTTIFGILGNLAHETGSEDISTVVRSGTGLAFISYPEALAKFTIVPQMFAILFFLMLFVLGVGSAVAFSSVIISVIKDQFPRIQQWIIAFGVSSVGVLIGITYCTPGGQYMLNLIDYFGGTFIIVFLASFEVIAVAWIYGIDNFLDDVEFMVGTRPSAYWRYCWGCLTPLMLFVILAYFLATLTPLTYNDTVYPTLFYAAGWIILALGVVPFPIFMIIETIRKKGKSLFESFKSTDEWGPKNVKVRGEWMTFKEIKRRERSDTSKSNKTTKILAVLFNK